MQKGKISEIAYKRSVIKKITEKTDGIEPGVDAAEFKLEDVTAVMSSNCILEYFEGCEMYYLQKTLNCIYEKAGKPQCIQLKINIPEDFPEKQLGRVIRNFNDAAIEKNLRISQCRVYAGSVDSIIIHVTVLGSSKEELSFRNIKPNMDVVMAGTVGIGGMAVISHHHKEQLQKKFSQRFVMECLELKNHIDVKMAADIAVDNGAVYMHNVSDGGVFGAVWELTSACGLGVTVNVSDIPVWQETVEVAEMFDINPYLVDGTGAMLIITSDGEEIVNRLNDEGIYASVIGKITDSKDRIAVNGDEVRYLEPPRGDELYKLI